MLQRSAQVERGAQSDLQRESIPTLLETDAAVHQPTGRRASVGLIRCSGHGGKSRILVGGWKCLLGLPVMGREGDPLFLCPF